MDKVVKKVFKNIFDVLDLETDNLKKVEGKGLDRFKEIYNLEFDDFSVYHNNSTLIITDKEVFSTLEFTLSEDDLIAKIEVPEYGFYLYAIRFIKNYMMIEALDLHDMFS
jgi:hypothetical protein